VYFLPKKNTQKNTWPNDGSFAPFIILPSVVENLPFQMLRVDRKTGRRRMADTASTTPPNPFSTSLHLPKSITNTSLFFPQPLHKSKAKLPPRYASFDLTTLYFTFSSLIIILAIQTGQLFLV
jgi:hypothetical protein